MLRATHPYRIHSASLTALAVFIVVGGAPALGGETPRARPNVLFIAIDDLNDWVGCLDGHPNAKTPNIDSLAERGVLFTNAHCQAPICGPTRASLFTGLYPATTGIYLQIDDPDIRDSSPATKVATFLPDYFEQHGYKTMGVGKLFHQGDKAGVFQEYGGRFEGSGPKPKKRFHYDPKWFGKPGSTQTDWGAYPERDDQMPDYKSAKWAIERLNRTHDKPFFLAVGFVRPHVPWYVPKKWLDMHPIEGIKTPPYKPDDFDDIPEMAARVADVPMMPTTEWMKETNQWRAAVQAYLACTTWTDHWVGEVVRALENSPYADNTIVVLWSDHGYHLGEKNRFAKQAIWERDTRVPLIIAGPGVEGGKRCARPVGLIDLYPTLLSMCGLPGNPQNEGRDLSPLLEDPGREWNHPAITSYGPVNHTVRSDRYRYIRYEGGAEEFYDMKNDPNEWTNLAGDPGYADEIAAHRKHLPKNPAPLAEKSRYGINEYFKERLEKWRQ